MRKYTYTAFKAEKDKMLLSAVIISLILYFAFSVTYFSAVSGEIRGEVVRLHILAESDLKIDQEIKLRVRDALLEKNNELLSGRVTTQNVDEYFHKSKKALEKCANQVLQENGQTYKARVVLCEEYYTTRVYGDLTFPAGIYTSVKVILGSGEGQNWWCVMFPPLCVPAASGEVSCDEEILLEEYLNKDGKKIVMSDGKYKIKFKVLEIYEKIAECLN